MRKKEGMQQRPTKPGTKKFPERLLALFDDLEVLIHVIDLDTHELLYLNPCSRKIYGDSQGKSCWQVFHPGTNGPCQFCPNKKLLNGGGKPTGSSYVWEVKSSINGHWYENRDKAFLWDDGRLVKLQIATEINKRVKAEEELRKANQEWEQIFDAMPDAVAVIDNQFLIDKVNKSFADRLGTKQKQSYEGKRCYEVVHAEEEPPASCPHLRTLEDLNPHSKDMHLERLKGFFRFSVSPIKSLDGSVKKCVHIAHDITQRKQAEEALQHAHDTLEKRVAERTERLNQTNSMLKRKVEEHRSALEQLKKQTLELDEANIALKVLLNQGSETKRDLEQKIVSNLNDLVCPYIDILEKMLTKPQEKKYLEIIKANINKVTSSFSYKLSSKMVGLTTREIQIADLVKEGKTNKEIAQIMHLSVGTIETFRNNIRKKLGIRNKKINLRSYLLSRLP